MSVLPTGYPTKAAIRFNNVPAQSDGRNENAFDDLKALLGALDNIIHSSKKIDAEHTVEASFTLTSKAVMPLHRPSKGPYAEGGHSDIPSEFQDLCSRDNPSDHGIKLGRDHEEAKSDMFIDLDSLLVPSDLRTRKIVQRAASRGIILGIEERDGFRYSFKNAWSGKDDDANGFSYTCIDSMQNQDRKANGYIKAHKHCKSERKRKFYLPTYDCKGSIMVRFDPSKRVVDVKYKHCIVHPSSNEVKRLAKVRRVSHSGLGQIAFSASNIASAVVDEELSLVHGLTKADTIEKDDVTKKRRRAIDDPKTRARRTVSANRPLRNGSNHGLTASALLEPASEEIHDQDSATACQPRLLHDLLSFRKSVTSSTKSARNVTPNRPSAAKTLLPAPLQFKSPYHHAVEP